MADITVTSDALQVEPGEYPITATAKLRTPVSSAGFTAELIIDGKVYSTYTSTRQLNAAYNSYTIAFPDKVSLAMNQTVNYTIKLTPNYEGAESVSIDGSVTCAAGFPAVAVEEEATGVRCGWCPFGAAWMSYLADTYPDKFIGIAIHGGGYALGAMTAPGYSNEFIGNMGVDGYPWGIINRTKVVAPHYLNDVLPQLEKIWAKNVAYGVKINKTYYYSEDNKITVDFSPLTSVDVDNANLKACAILLCDGLTGTDAKWTQLNNYANYSGNSLTQFGVTSENNEALYPYYSYYTENSNSIQNCVFDHVPMGAWPDWRGNDCPLNAEMSVANPANYSITFDIPMQTKDNGFGVQDMTKTSVVVMLFDGKTGAVVTAAKMPYKDYWQGTAVKATDAASKMNAYRLGNQIKVTGDEGTLVEMYSIDGTLLGKKVISGEDFIAPISYRGVVLLRLTNGNDIVLKKVVL